MNIPARSIRARLPSLEETRALINAFNDPRRGIAMCFQILGEDLGAQDGYVMILCGRLLDYLVALDSVQTAPRHRGHIEMCSARAVKVRFNCGHNARYLWIIYARGTANLGHFKAIEEGLARTLRQALVRLNH